MTGPRRASRLAGLCLLVIWAGAAARDGFDRWVASTTLPVLAHATAPEVRARDGRLLRAYTVGDGTWRMAVSADAVDPRFFAMLVAYEDKRFRHHSGVDLRALIRAGAQALRAGRIVSGGSTLTMQVARLLEGSGTGSWAGKRRQIRVALALERRFSKTRILDLYLHLAPYGGNIEGIRAASLIWLGKEPARLTAAEAALLVALPQAPETRRPDRHPETARAARDRVLARMARAGVLSHEEAATMVRDPVPAHRHAMPRLAPHLSDRAIAAGPGRHDVTIDADLQASLEGLTAAHMQGRDARLSMAVMVADSATGEILASVGARDYADDRSRGFVDMTRAVRSPGSTLKPVIYGLAFDRGLAHPQTMISDTPVSFGTYAPQNFDRVFRGDVTVARALQLSLNIPVVRLTEAMGPAHLLAALRQAGADPELSGKAPGLAVSLGGIGLTLRDLVQVYAALAQGGQAMALHWRSGAAETTPAVPVLSRAAAWQVGHVLAQIVPPPAAGPPGRVAWKTGTSYGHRDAWALGWDGQHVAGVWIGRPDGTPVPGAFGGALAAPALFEVLARARGGMPALLPAPPPETLLVPTAQLPARLQRFGAAVGAVSDLTVVFPPDGAVLDHQGALPVKLRGGTPPYTIILDGAVASTGTHRAHVVLRALGPGFSRVTVLDSTGASARVDVELRDPAVPQVQ